ncbi:MULTISPECIES: hypothetical protein [Cytobacillus]|uniref:hypothetical protein n=1 Tax=Cytobacillus TaxID=2675230 RepID=UPI00203BCF3A|nr:MULTISPECIES: hypothetical protein [Cytobacillus]MCM3394877.1 hypothetical protein [Cytobacillus oceanisediminis]UQX56042.1 hypothetical protein M5V91_10670 [Cytobacillus pseudoceanisediminis]
MIEGEGLGNKKVNRVNISLTNKVNQKLCRLAVSCNLKPTTLAGMIVEVGLNNPVFIDQLQREYGVHNAYKVVPVKDFNSGELVFTLNERA